MIEFSERDGNVEIYGRYGKGVSSLTSLNFMISWFFHSDDITEDVQNGDWLLDAKHTVEFWRDVNNLIDDYEGWAHKALVRALDEDRSEGGWGFPSDCACCETEGTFVPDQDGACASCRHEPENHYGGEDGTA